MGMERPQSFFEWSSLLFSPEIYQARRERLLALLCADDGVMLIPSRHGPGESTFRQNDAFNYFTGLELPDSMLVADSRDGVTLYLPHEDARFTSPVRPNDFPGRPLLDDPDFRAKAGIDRLRPMEEFDGRLQTFGARPVYLPMPNRQPLDLVQTGYIFHWDTAQGLAYHLAHTTQLALKNGYELMARLRMIKGPEEVETIRRAVKITEESILATLPMVKPGVDERTLIGKLEFEFRRRGSQRNAFDSIVKGGLNAHCAWRILGSHYDRRNQVLKDGDAVVFDVGAEYNYYASDIGRTFPVGERFTPMQYDRLQRVHDVVLAVTQAVRPGVTLGELRQVALRNLAPEHHPYMQVDSYYGHHIGLSAGDPSLMEEPLQPGMVFTIEPWYYNHVDHVSVFIEENVVVTQNGVEVLSNGIPHSPDDLQRIRTEALEKIEP